MKKKKTYIEELELQSNAIEKQANRYDIPDYDKENLFSAKRTIDRNKRKEERKQEVETHIRKLDDNPSRAMVQHARQRQSVQYDKCIYLPSWEPGTFVLPNVMIRSALFSVSSKPVVATGGRTIQTQGKNAIKLNGVLLDYDRLVLAALLNLAKDTPLKEEEESDAPWVHVTYWAIAQAMLIPYGVSAQAAIRKSLIRLSSAALRIRINYLQFDLPHLIELKFIEAPKRKSSKSPEGIGEEIAFRFPKNIAELFGMAAWTKVPPAAMKHSGLVRWLATYYSSHSKQYPLPLKDLRDFSGATCDIPEFKRRLNQALLRLSQDDIPPEIRVIYYEFDKSKDTMTVYLLRWDESKKSD